MQTTDNPALVCPPWCSERNHGFDTTTEDERAWVRYHGHIIARVDTPSEVTGRDHSTLVELNQEEQVNTETGLVTRLDPHIMLWSENADLTAAQARKLAAALLEAADKLEEIGR